jgi:uncharacterized protein with FMN-binding domain
MRRVILAIVGTAAALVFILSFKTHTASPALGASSAIAGPTPGSGVKSAQAPGTASAGAAATSKSATGKSGSSAKTTIPASGTARTLTGDAVQTIYGAVQVQITVKGGKITAVNALEYPEGTPRDYQINAYAIPQLNSETLAANSASINAVSGATYTSQGYIGSLQSAVDKAGL